MPNDRQAIVVSHPKSDEGISLAHLNSLLADGWAVDNTETLPYATAAYELAPGGFGAALVMLTKISD